MPQVAHIAGFKRNLGDVTRLLEVHSLVASTIAGRGTALKVLNRSAVVLLSACWEAYVEDLAVAAFDFLLSNCDDPNKFPNRVRARAVRKIREDKDELAAWALASEGWKEVLAQHRDEAIRSAVSTFNSPKAARIDELFANLIGLPRLSLHWRWPGNSPAMAREKLERLLVIRGDIAHRARYEDSLRRPDLDIFIGFTHRLSVLSHNAVAKHLSDICSASPWPLLNFVAIDIGSPDDRRRRIKPSWGKEGVT